MWRREDFGIGTGGEIKVINKKSDIGLGTPRLLYQSQSLIKNIAGNRNFLRGTTIRTFPLGIFFSLMFFLSDNVPRPAKRTSI